MYTHDVTNSNVVLLTGYNEVAVIPRGATNLRIEQRGFNHSKDDGIYLGKS